MMRLFFYILTILGCLVSEGVAFLYLNNEGLGHNFWLSHLLAASWFVLYLYRRGEDVFWRDRYLPLSVFGFLLFAFFPGLGLLAWFILLSYVRVSQLSRTRKVFEEYESYISKQPYGEERLDNSLDVMRQFRLEVGFEPFVDILLGDKVTFKATVIRKLAEQITPGNIQLLQMALKDRNSEIRLYAAGALMKIESKLNEQIRKTAQRAQARGTYLDYTEWGDLYRLYAILGAGGTLSQYYLRQAIAAYQRSLDMNTNQPQTISYYCRMLIEVGDFDRARILVDRALKIWPENADVVFLANELSFETGDFGKIAGRFSSIASLEREENRIRIMEFWGSAQKEDVQ